MNLVRDKAYLNATPQTSSKKGVLFFVTSAVLLLLGHYGFASGSNVIIGSSFCIAALMTFFWEKRLSFALFLLLIPSNRIFTLGPISVLSIIAIAYVLKYFVFSRKGSRISSSMLVACSLLACYGCFQSLIDQSIVPFFSAAKIILLLFMIVDCFIDHKAHGGINDTALVLSLGILFSTFVGVLIDPSALGDTERLSVGNESGQNVLGITCSFAAMVLLVVQYRDGIKANVLPVLVLLCVVGIMTGSRSFMLSFVIGCLCIAIGAFASLSASRIFQLCVLLLLLCAAAAILIQFFPSVESYLEALINRVINPKNGDISNSRFDIWAQYIAMFLDNPAVLLFGTSSLIEYGIDIVAHNFILEQLASFGIVGSLLVVLVYCCAFHEIWVLRFKEPGHFLPKSVVEVAPLAVLLSASCFSHTLLGIPQTVMLFISVVAIWSYAGMEARG